MSEEPKTTQLPENNTHPEDNGGAPGKTFTQEEVNHIVSERLARERAKSDPSPEDEREKALREREEAIAHKELMIEAKNKMNEMGLPHELLEAMNSSTPEAFEKSLNLLNQQFNERHAAYVSNGDGTFRKCMPGENINMGTFDSVSGITDEMRIREAMGLSKKQE